MICMLYALFCAVMFCSFCKRIVIVNLLLNTKDIYTYLCTMLNYLCSPLRCWNELRFCSALYFLHDSSLPSPQSSYLSLSLSAIFFSACPLYPALFSVSNSHSVLVLSALLLLFISLFLSGYFSYHHNCVSFPFAISLSLSFSLSLSLSPLSCSLITWWRLWGMSV